MAKIILGLGGNLGNRATHLKQAINALSEHVADIAQSTIYESVAVLPEGAPAEWNIPFYNMAISGTTELAPEELLTAIKSIEMSLGRQQRDRWAPREIDIDILAYGEEALETVELSIPHPYLLKRDFALLPLAELWPNWRCPLAGEYAGQNAADIAQQLGYGANEKLKPVQVTLHAA